MEKKKVLPLPSSNSHRNLAGKNNTSIKLAGKKVYMTPSEADTIGYERVSKYPKSTKYGRQNLITNAGTVTNS